VCELFSCGFPTKKYAILISPWHITWLTLLYFHRTPFNVESHDNPFKESGTRNARQTRPSRYAFIWHTGCNEWNLNHTRDQKSVGGGGPWHWSDKETTVHLDPYRWFFHLDCSAFNPWHVELRIIPGNCSMKHSVSHTLWQLTIGNIRVGLAQE
jgi:hypothetical protein